MITAVADTAVRIGVDFGGTKIEVAALDMHGEFRARLRAPTPGSYDAAVRAVQELVGAVEAQIGAQGTIGVGAPGSVSPRSGLMRNANSNWLNGRPFREDLAAALGRPVRVANDANCLALSEIIDGAAVGSRVCFAAILGTGCGGGLVVDGKLLEGAHGVTGEWGHTPLPWPTSAELDSQPCWCGKRGCLELWISGSGFARDYARLRGENVTVVTAEEIVALARSGDTDAQRAMQRYIDRLARGLGVISTIVDPDTIVLGGGMSNVTELYGALPQAVPPYVFSDTWHARILPARWGDSSGVRGAARLW